MNKIIHRITDFKEKFQKEPLNAIGIAVPAAMVFFSVIGAIVGLFRFISADGYAAQLALMKTDIFDFDSISESFTKGTVSILYGGFFGSMAISLAILQLLLILYRYFRTVTKVKKALMIIALAAAGIMMAGKEFVRLIYIGQIDFFSLPEAVQYVVPRLVEGEYAQVSGLLFCAAALVILISFVKLVCSSEGRDAFYAGCRAGLWSFVILPLILLLAENVVPLTVGIGKFLLLGVVVIIVVILGWILLGEAEGSSGTSTASAGSSRDAGKQLNVKAYRPANKETHSETKDNCRYVDRGFLGFKLYRVHGILHDYVEQSNGIGQSEICSLYDLRKGKFHIYDQATKKEIREEEIPWRK